MYFDGKLNLVRVILLIFIHSDGLMRFSFGGRYLLRYCPTFIGITVNIVSAVVHRSDFRPMVKVPDKKINISAGCPAKQIRYYISL